MSMVRGRAGMSLDWSPITERFFCKVRVSTEGVKEDVRGAVMERGRAIPTGAIVVMESGMVEEDRLRGC